MTQQKTLEHICEITGCKHYRVWDFGHKPCFSCELIGQSYYVTEYPDNCPFIDEMKKEEKHLDHENT